MQFGFLLLFYKLEDLVSLEDKGLSATRILNILHKIWVIFFLNTSYPFLETVDFLLPKSGALQDFHNLIDDSALKSNEHSSSLD